MTADMVDVRHHFWDIVLSVAHADDRIVGVVDYGSSSEGRSDRWSDIDVALFLRDADLAAFEADWKRWAGQFGPLLLAYVGGIGHPWTIYDTHPIPLRVDFAFHPVSAASMLLTWPNQPVSADAMVRYDDTGGVLRGYAEQLVGQSLAPSDLVATYQQVCGDLWYYLLRTWSKLQRGQEWAAYYDVQHILVGNLLALLRLEAGATSRWKSASAAVGIEQVLTPERLAALHGCRIEAHGGDVEAAMRAVMNLAMDVSTGLLATNGWSWPEEVANRVRVLLAEHEEA